MTLAVQQSDVSFVVICPSWLLHNSAGPRPGQSFFCPRSSLCLPALILAWLHNYTKSAKFIRPKPENMLYICVSHKGLGNPYFWIYWCWKGPNFLFFFLALCWWKEGARLFTGVHHCMIWKKKKVLLGVSSPKRFSTNVAPFNILWDPQLHSYWPSYGSIEQLQLLYSEALENKPLYTKRTKQQPDKVSNGQTKRVESFCS